jgi:hypothetical protein
MPRGLIVGGRERPAHMIAIAVVAESQIEV